MSGPILDLNAVAAMDKNALRALWEEQYGHPPPARIGEHLLRLSAAWWVQAKYKGGISASLRRQIKAAHTALKDGKAPAAVQKSATPGTTLIREWRGKHHHVEVKEDGVWYNGRCYKSLTAVTKQITGGHRSGPIFFGLKQQKR